MSHGVENWGLVAVKRGWVPEWLWRKTGFLCVAHHPLHLVFRPLLTREPTRSELLPVDEERP